MRLAWCGGLEENVPHRLRYLNIWFLVAGVWGGLVGKALLEEVRQWGRALRKPPPFPVGSLCFVLMAEEMKSQLSALAAMPAVIFMPSCLSGTTAKTSPVPCKLCWLWCFRTAAGRN